MSSSQLLFCARLSKKSMWWDTRSTTHKTQCLAARQWIGIIHFCSVQYLVCCVSLQSILSPDILSRCLARRKVEKMADVFDGGGGKRARRRNAHSSMQSSLSLAVGDRSRLRLLLSMREGGMLAGMIGTSGTPSRVSYFTKSCGHILVRYCREAKCYLPKYTK